MRCSEARDRLMDYVAAELPPGEAEELRNHLAACGSCCTGLALARRASEALGFLRGQEPAPEVLSAVRQRIEGEKLARRPVPAPRLAAAFSILLIGILIAAGWFWHRPPVRERAPIVSHPEQIQTPAPAGKPVVKEIQTADRPVMESSKAPAPRHEVRKPALRRAPQRKPVPAPEAPALAEDLVEEVDSAVASEPDTGEPVMMFVLEPREPETYTIQVSDDAEADAVETSATELNVVREFDVGGRVTSVTIAETVASADISYW